MTYLSTKTYGHDIGLSCCFRQWRAKSHCRFLHGYALAIRLEFEAAELDENNWVVDFGSLSEFKSALVDTFDHKLLIAQDDPERARMAHLGQYGIANVIIVSGTGCEAFAKMIHDLGIQWLANTGYSPRVWLRSVTVSEHGANSAIYMGDHAGEAVKKNVAVRKRR